MQVMHRPVLPLLVAVQFVWGKAQADYAGLGIELFLCTTMADSMSILLEKAYGLT
jgi:hypothetical protein